MKKYEHIDFKPPKAVAQAAVKGLEYRRRAGGKGGLSVEEAAKEGIGSGVQRAVDLKNRDTLSPDTVKRMKAFFDRHQKNKSVNPEYRGEPWKDRGYVAWLLWGGDPGYSWAKKVVEQMEEADKPKKVSWDEYRIATTLELKPFRQIRAEMDPDNKHDHHFRFVCGKCGDVETCRCSAPKETFVGLCPYCEGIV